MSVSEVVQIVRDSILTMNDWAARITETVKAKGFKTPTDIGVCPSCGQDPVVAKLGLVVTEVAEAIEAARKGDRVNFDEEIADTFIRLLDLAGAMKIDVDGQIFAKQQKNAARPPMHNKTC